MTTLPPAFTLEQARAAGFRKDEVYDLLATGRVERAARGVYLQPDFIDPSLASLAAATAVRVESTLCLTSALVHHGLSDEIPFETDIALPRGIHHPAGFSHVSWRNFNPETFDIGRELVSITGGISVAIYSAERTIIDSFRLMHLEGSPPAHKALRRWIREPGNTPASLLRMARSFPRALPSIRRAFEALL